MKGIPIAFLGKPNTIYPFLLSSSGAIHGILRISLNMSSPDDLIVHCECGKTLRARREWIGELATCKSCGRTHAIVGPTSNATSRTVGGHEYLTDSVGETNDELVLGQELCRQSCRDAWNKLKESRRNNRKGPELGRLAHDYEMATRQLMDAAAKVGRFNFGRLTAWLWNVHSKFVGGSYGYRSERVASYLDEHAYRGLLKSMSPEQARRILFQQGDSNTTVEIGSKSFDAPTMKAAAEIYVRDLLNSALIEGGFIRMSQSPRVIAKLYQLRETSDWPTSFLELDLAIERLIGEFAAVDVVVAIRILIAPDGTQALLNVMTEGGDECNTSVLVTKEMKEGAIRTATRKCKRNALYRSTFLHGVKKARLDDEMRVVDPKNWTT